MATFLITGGAGFIGSHLTEAILAQGHRVLVIDDLSSGSIENLALVRQHKNFEFVPESVTEKRVLAELVDRADMIFHLAATVGVFNIIESPVTTIMNNIGGTECVLKLAAKKKKKVLVASTSEVYGKSTAIPFHEDADLISGPTSKSRWSYAASKAVDEFLALAFWKEYGVPTVVARLFNCIGPRQVGRYGMVVPRFIGQALDGRNLTVYGSGQQSRCFTYVSDVVQWLLMLIENEAAVGQVVNLGNPDELSILDLARKVIAVAGAQVDIDFIPYDQAYEEGFEDMQRRVPDISKITALTGYAPKVSIEDSLRLTCEWFRAQRAAPAVAAAAD
jgi:nucleoside-diphosphate-sugar epimerase